MNNTIQNSQSQRILNEGYVAGLKSKKYQGVLLEKSGKDVRVDLGENKMLTAQLKTEIDASVGDSVTIEKRDIVAAEIQQKSEYTPGDPKTSSPHEKLIEKMGLSPTKDHVEGMKTLEKFGMELTRENLLSYIGGKKQLQRVSSELDYEKALKLVEKNVDLEKDSLQKIGDELEKIKGEKPNFLQKLFSFKKELSTEEAESKAKELYGSKMGKDITDIIKAVHKTGGEMSKENINKIHETFSKLDNLKDLKEENLIDSIKNKIDPSIKNLYKMKNAVVSGAIKTGGAIGKMVSKLYGGTQPQEVSAKDLKGMEKEIAARLEGEGLKSGKEEVALAKKMIARGIPLTKENFEKARELKDSLAHVSKDLNYERASVISEAKGDLESKDLRELSGLLREVQDAEVQKEQGGQRLSEQARLLERMEALEGQKSENMALHMRRSIPVSLKNMEEMAAELTAEKAAESAQPKTEETLQQNLALGKALLKNGMAINRENLVQLFEHQQNFDSIKLGLQNLRGGAIDMEKLMALELGEARDAVENQSAAPTETKAGLDGGINRLMMMDTLKSIEPNTMAFHRENQLPETVEALKLSQDLLTGKISEKAFQEGLKAMDIPTENLNLAAKNNLRNQNINTANNSPMKDIGIKALENRIINILDKISPEFLKQMEKEGLTPEKMELGELNKALQDFAKEHKQDLSYQRIQDMVDTLKEGLGKNASKEEGLLSLMVKNQVPMNLKEAYQMTSFLNNKGQIGAEMKGFVDTLEREMLIREEQGIFSKEMRELLQEGRALLGEMATAVKNGTLQQQKPYQTFANFMEKMESQRENLDRGTLSALRESGERVLSAIETQSNVNRQDTLLQLPMMFGGEMKNLQMYVMQDEKKTKKIDPKDMSILLNFDTKSLGNVNMYLGVKHRNVVMKVGIEDGENQQVIEGYREKLEKLLGEVGYQLKELTFKVDEGIHTLSLADEIKDLDKNKRGLLDMKV
ncbi:DUF6240 domain-containing protein [Isachenkonia alkalipeptolytica]|uniref:Flagellar hook-length control protein FliK n=1 Tax=Isachenkonia alkalipeptolytica TaxID=2565777 RepID=A0AA43XN57_9CLOT|nr:DUF6240 domain-containing protein [Isachenkonia alkalipeptolytica]NBG89389.1 hypothetical protein [Isachenkonia alkalipeptolytica]